MRRGLSFQLLAAERLPGHLRAGALRLLGACLAIWALGMLSPEIDEDTAVVVLIVGWSVIARRACSCSLMGTQRVLARLDVPLLGPASRASRRCSSRCGASASSCSRSRSSCSGR